MKPQRRARLSLEQLEDRRCPSLTVTLVSGSLYITGVPSGATADPNGPTLAVTETGTNQFRVTDGNTFLGTYNVPGNMVISLSHRPNNVDIALNSSGLQGYLQLSLGTGDTVGPPSAIFVHGGRIGGTLTILSGNGNESFDLGAGPNGSSPLTVGGDVTVNASRSTGIGLFTPPRDTLTLFGGSTLAASLNTLNVDSVFLDLGSAVNRSVTVNDVVENTSDDVFVLGSVGLDMTITGAPAGTFVSLQGPIGRNLYFAHSQMGIGQDHVSLVSTATVGGSASIFTGLGDDIVELSGQVFGSANVNMGQGNDTFEFDGTSQVFGNLSVTGGNGTNSVPLFQGLVDGNLSFNFGNGNNNPVTVVFAPGGLLTWRSGNGNNHLTLGTAPNSGNFNVDVTFGSGDDTFTLDNGTGVLSGRVDGGGRITANVFEQLSGTLAPTFQLINFP